LQSNRQLYIVIKWWKEGNEQSMCGVDESA
jgi:hypothetical protein